MRYESPYWRLCRFKWLGYIEGDGLGDRTAQSIRLWSLNDRELAEIMLLKFGWLTGHRLLQSPFFINVAFLLRLSISRRISNPFCGVDACHPNGTAPYQPDTSPSLPPASPVLSPKLSFLHRASSAVLADKLFYIHLISLLRRVYQDHLHQHSSLSL
ncbi:hypothetical protein YC2023_030359 [Brassica napus]